MLPGELGPDVVAALQVEFESEARIAAERAVAAHLAAHDAHAVTAYDPDNPTFGAGIKRIRFVLRGEQFDLPGVLPAAKLVRLAELQNKLPDMSSLKEMDEAAVSGLLGMLGDIIAMLLPQGAGTRIRAMILDPDEGLDIFSETMPLMQYLVRMYTGGRPLAVSSPSSIGTEAETTGTPAAPTSSTDGASPTP